jgi:sugar (pentulose or hexulose) kinase
LIAFPLVYLFLLAMVVFAAVVDIVVGVLLAAGMLGKSAVGLTTGSLATAFSAADNYLFEDPESCASPKMG